MKTVLIAAIVLLGITCIYAQSSVPLKDGKQWAKFLSETPHRMKMIVEMRDTQDSNWELYSSQTKEVAGDRWHLIQHTGLKFEIIGIDGRTYQKLPEGSWQVGNARDGYTGATVRSISKPMIQFSEIQNKDGSKVVDTRTQWTQQVIRTGEVVDMDRKTREWFDEAGRLVRVETEHFNFERKKFQKNTEVYEYDPNIRIEAPIPD
jgi:hypothetical protein